MPKTEQSFATQTVDTFIDGAAHPPIEHPNESAARSYAQDHSHRTRSEVRILADGRIADLYEGGTARSAKQAWLTSPSSTSSTP